MATIVLEGCSTLAQMVARGQPVRVLCTGCAGCHDVDLAALAARMGGDYSLINRRCRCRLTEGCGGWNRFYVLHGVYRPLWDDVAARRWFFRLTAALRS